MILKISIELWKEMGNGILITLAMTLLSSFFAYLIGIPIGVVLNVTSNEGIKTNKTINAILGVFVNVLRSVPFVILAIMIMPFTRFLVGYGSGTIGAMVVPLTISAAPFIARMVESSLKEVDGGKIEAAQAMGSSNFQIIFKVLLKEAMPSLIVGASISIATILGYTAVAGFIGSGGIGAIATNYGYYRSQEDVMFVACLILVVLVQLFQEGGTIIEKIIDKRRK